MTIKITAPAYVETALNILADNGYEGYLVGGCVRDSLLGRIPNDWDVTTNALPAQLQALFANYHVLETGLQHGTVTVVIDRQPLEITTYRIDGAYSDHRRPDQVCFSADLRADLARRDFTINAMAYSPRQGLVDVYGGVADLQAGLIRCVGQPEQRFNEDGLRILRALRFAAVLGYQVEAETAASLLRKRQLLTYISAERCREELSKLLCGRAVGAMLRGYLPVLATVLPELLPLAGFDQRNPHHCFDVWQHTVAVVEQIPAEPVLRWAALLHDLGKPACFSLGPDGVGHFYGHAGRSRELAAAILRRLKFDNASRERILLLVAQHDTPFTTDRHLLKRWLNRLGPEALGQLLQLARADNLGQAPAYRQRQAELDRVEAAIKELLAAAACFSLRDLAVTGRDLLPLGYQGPAIGQALSVLLEAVMAEKVANEQEALLAYLQNNY